MTLHELCRNLEIAYDGDDPTITGLSALQEAKPGEVSFLDNKRYVKYLPNTKASAVFVKPEHVDQMPEGVIALVTPTPYMMIAKASALFLKPRLEQTGQAPVIGEGSVVEGAYVADGAVIGKNCLLMPGVFIGNDVVIGDNTVLYPNVTVYRDCRIGSDCIIHAGVVIGSDGFGFASTPTGEHVKIYQNGNVIIEDDVEIGANSTVDRAVFSSTIIKTGVRIDNLVQIGHNCVIGEHSIIVALCGLSGSTKLGRNVIMGGQAATAGHLDIAPFTTIAARGAVNSSIEKTGVYSGAPIMEHKTWLRLQRKLRQLLKE